MNTVWLQYCVIGYSWKVTAFNGSVDMFELIVLPSGVVQTFTNLDEMLIQDNAQKKIMMGNLAGSSGNGLAAKVSISGYSSVKSLTGVDPIIEPDYWGTDSANPAKTTRLYVGVRNFFGATTTNKIDLYVEICAYVKMFQRKKQTITSLEGVEYCNGVNPSIARGIKWQSAVGQPGSNQFVEEEKEEEMVEIITTPPQRRKR